MSTANTETRELFAGTFHTPRMNQGQIVIVSYAQMDGVVIRETYDQSDQSMSYATSKARDDDEGDYRNVAPPNKRWKQATAAQLNRMFGEDVAPDA